MTAPLSIALPLAQATDEESGGSFLVSPDVGMMIWTLAVFAVAMLLLWKLAFPLISGVLEKRQRAIEDSLDAAAETKREADELLAEYRERLKQAREQADEIVTRAFQAGSEHERQSLEEARKRREELLEQTRRDIQAETEKAVQDIRREVAALTIAATERVTRKALSADDQQRLVDEALSELDFSVFGESR